MEPTIKRWFKEELNRITRKFDIDLKIKFRIIDNTMPTLHGLLSEFNVLIHLITFEGGKTAQFRIRQYSDIIKILKNYPKTELTNPGDIKNFLVSKGKKNPKKIMIRIEEYINKGYIQDAKDAMTNPQVRAIIELTKIYAIGPSKCKELYEKHGIVTIDDLRKKFKKDSSIINNKQIIGLTYHEDLEKRIPRAEVDKYNAVLKNICNEISPNLIMSINGSYRRGLLSSGDIDLLITGPKDQSEFLRKKLIETLKKKGIVKEVLASGKKKFMGIVKLEKHGYNIARHMDIIDTAPENYPFAVLYFTGSGGFNSMMRGVALTKGYSMNEYCLSHKKTKKPIESTLIQEKIGKTMFETEKDIFRFLDMDYVEPKDRNNITMNKLF